MLELSKTISCLLCRDTVIISNGAGIEIFDNHMNYEHSASYDLDLMLAASFMDIEEKSVITEKIKRQLVGASCERILDVSNVVQDISKVIEATCNGNDDEIIIVNSPKNITEKTKPAYLQRCRICGEHFTSKQNYLHHIKKYGTNCNKLVVEGQQAFPCDKCTASFAQFGSLIRHRKEFHGMRNKRPREHSLEIEIVDISEPNTQNSLNSNVIDASGLEVKDLSSQVQYLPKKSNINGPKFHNEKTTSNRNTVTGSVGNIAFMIEASNKDLEEKDDCESLADIMEACLEVNLSVKEIEASSMEIGEQRQVHDNIDSETTLTKVKI